MLMGFSFRYYFFNLHIFVAPNVHSKGTKPVTKKVVLVVSPFLHHHHHRSLSSLHIVIVVIIKVSRFQPLDRLVTLIVFIADIV